MDIQKNMIEVIKTTLDGCFLFKPKKIKDNRGYFFESYRTRWFFDIIKENVQFVQDNQSFSRYGTIRGLHFQKPPFQQAKLVRAVVGSVLDTVLDLRAESKTFGKTFSIELSGENNIQLYIPKGFAHGFSVLSETAIVCYKCDQYYSAEHESGINPLDEDLKIDWRISKDNRMISKKDKKHQSFKEFKNE